MNRILMPCACLLLTWGPFQLTALADPPQAPVATQAVQLIQKLEDPQYPVRVDSEHKLRRLGVDAIPALRDAMNHDSPEIALRVKKLLADAQQQLLARLEVRMDAKPDHVAWGEPFDLVLTFKNPTPYEMVLPILPESPEAPNTAAAQVGAMLDIADHLEVVAPDGREIELHLTDVKEDPAVDHEVNRRLNVTEELCLPAGQTYVHTIRQFNRGWARYRMLRKGIYQIRYELRIEPESTPNDDRPPINVMSNHAGVSITDDAPPDVEATGVKLRADLDLRDGELQLTLTNTYDQPVVLHNQIGQPLDRFASIRWWVHVDETKKVVTDVAAWNTPSDEKRFITLAPAQKVEILRKPLADFWTMPDMPRVALGESVLFNAVYLNFYSRSTLLTKPLPVLPAEQLRQDVDALPLFVYTGSAVSNQLTLTRKNAPAK
jgi:hypothetical protein